MKISFSWHYETKHGLRTLFTGEPLSIQDAILLYEDLYQTGRVNDLHMVDEFDSSWTIKQLKKYAKEIASEPSNILIYFDGGFQDTTNEAGVGIVIYYEQHQTRYRIRENQAFPFLLSNNEAEFAALAFAIQQLQLLNVKGQEIVIKGDSQVVIQQMNGEWPVYNSTFARWIEKIEQQLSQQKLRATYKLVTRNENKEAHKLAVQALQHTKISANKKL